MGKMKAIVCTKYGPPEVLQLKEVEKPIPKDNEVLVKIYATAVTASDCIVRGFKVPLLMKIPMALAVGFPKPRNPILGQVLAGEIETAGKDVKRFKRGDRIIAFTYMRFGTYAEYTCLPEKSAMALKPSNITYEEAAAIPYGGMLALHNLKKGNIQSGQNILIYGASGAIGTSAIQLARYFGAKVTGVCSTANLEFVKSLGADEVIDYTKDDFAIEGELYDFIFDAVGKRKNSKFKVQCKKALAPNGKYISVDDGTPKTQAEDISEVLTLLKDLVEAEKIKPVIDRCYWLEQMVEAHQYVDKGHKKGNVGVTVNQK
jgi:NADPH:quinone reductase-like Zn-dependent oxidoreductase